MSKAQIWKTPLLALVILAVVGIGGGAWLQQRQAEDKNPYAGIGGNFTLSSAQGPISLSDFSGKVVMLFFGFTSCPDICPTDLARMNMVIKGLSPAESAKVAGLFVSVDPERDSPQRASEYAQFFNRQITGLSGSVDEIAAVAKQYLVIYAKVEDPGSALGYTVDHSATTYLIDRDGVIRDRIQHDASADEMREAIRNLL